MKEYIAKKVPYKLGIDDDKWDLVPAAELNEGWWDQFPKSYNATARLAHCDEGLILRMDAEEWPIKIKTMKVNSEVCLDSCMEFFFIPNTEDENYINIEATAGAVPLCYIGKEREGRKSIKPIEEGLEFKSLIEFGRGWRLYVFIPYSFIRSRYSSVSTEMRANFYKCGDETEIEHYNTWNKVETPEPDYHRPEFFGKVILSEESI